MADAENKNDDENTPLNENLKDVTEKQLRG